MLANPEQDERDQLFKQLEAIENSVNSLILPLAFADQQYVLREHIAMVRARMNALSGAPAPQPAGLA